MEVLLVDLILGDHSAPYASNVKRELEERDTISNVDFLTLEPDNRLDSCFDSVEDIYFLRQENGAGYSTSIVPSFVKMVKFIQQRSYTVVHILQVDNALVESATVLPDVGGLPPIVAQINGAFFGRERNETASGINRLLSGLLSSPLNRIVEAALVRKKSNEIITDSSLYHCIREDVFSQLLVHTDAAREYTSNLDNCTTPITVVPEPPTVDSPELSRETARQKVEISPDETVLLFFGGLRNEKGITRLLQSLQNYEGPEFTLLVAGPEGDVTEEDLREIEHKIVPSLFDDIRYIHESEPYFIASDGVLCPYLTVFGEERTSHVFQEAIRLQRPVICPGFGSFESRLNNYNLGVLYSPNTAQALNRAIQRFVENPEQCYSTQDMLRFSEKHSFESLCSTLIEIYQDKS